MRKILLDASALLALVKQEQGADQVSAEIEYAAINKIGDRPHLFLYKTWSVPYFFHNQGVRVVDFGLFSSRIWRFLFKQNQLL